MLAALTVSCTPLCLCIVNCCRRGCFGRPARYCTHLLRGERGCCIWSGGVMNLLVTGSRNGRTQGGLTAGQRQGFTSTQLNCAAILFACSMKRAVNRASIARM
jgi:hypothetical protein